MNYCNAELEPLTPKRIVIDDIRYPAAIFTKWSDAELAAIGIYRVKFPDDPIPEGKVIDHYTYVIEGDVCQATPVYVDAPEPVVEVPEEVEGWQAEVAMKLTKLDDQDSNSQSVWDRTMDIVEAMEDEAMKLTARTVLERGRVRRDSQMLATLSVQIPLSSEQVDSLFIFADSLEA